MKALISHFVCTLMVNTAFGTWKEFALRNSSAAKKGTGYRAVLGFYGLVLSKSKGDGVAAVQRYCARLRL